MKPHVKQHNFCFTAKNKLFQMWVHTDFFHPVTTDVTIRH